MSFLKTLQKIENIILGVKKENINSKDHWKKYRRVKTKQNI